MLKHIIDMAIWDWVKSQVPYVFGAAVALAAAWGFIILLFLIGG